MTSKKPPEETSPEIEVYRRLFERRAVDSFEFARSKRGVYVNPAVARDWKWFLLGAQINQKSLWDSASLESET
jgi:hypothetical protein